jgi:hypothetical protein
MSNTIIFFTQSYGLAENRKRKKKIFFDPGGVDGIWTPAIERASDIALFAHILAK